MARVLIHGSRRASLGPLLLLWTLLQAVFPLTVYASQSEKLAKLTEASDQTLFWGPYRPNLYSSVRSRGANGLTVGLSWTGLYDPQEAILDNRYKCEQNDIEGGYGWIWYDPRLGGEQVLHDTKNGLELKTTLVKVSDLDTPGGSWGLRVRGERASGPAQPLRTLVTLHAALEQKMAALKVSDFSSGHVTLEGDMPKVGQFALRVVPRLGQTIRETVVNSQNLEPGSLWRSSDALQSLFVRNVQEFGALDRNNLPPTEQLVTIKHDPSTATLQYIQNQFEGEFEFDVLFTKKGSEDKMSSQIITERITKGKQLFDKRFKDTFQPQAPFDGPEYEELSKSLLSNLMGGIGYFYGESVYDNSRAEEYDEDFDEFWEDVKEAKKKAILATTDPMELFTCVPSRPFFPRGFFWDEGFHLIPIVEWDFELAMQITRSWFSLMDEDGWIAREQILGEEARSRVPAEFQTQYPHYGNPPTLFLTVTSLINKVIERRQGTEPGYGESLTMKLQTDPNAQVSSAAVMEYLKELYPLLRKHYFWFRESQSGNVHSYSRETKYAEEVYRWRGRTPVHLLPSGLDDYPRPQPPSPGELHLDALSWVGFMGQHLHQISSLLEVYEDVAEYEEHLRGIKHNLDVLHWDKQARMFCDGTVDEFGSHKTECHAGYLSLFPFILGLIEPDDSRIGDILDLIQDRNGLWSPFGLRSLSKSDKLFGKGENYWRGPVWINMNYLVLKSLHGLATGGKARKREAERAAEMYTSLRKVLVQTVFREWKRTGTAWEQYSAGTGEGQGTRQFTGWTSLIVKVMAMSEISVEWMKDEL